MIKTQDFTIFASASAWVMMIICMHRRVKSACNDGAEKQSLGVWAVLCTAAMYHVNAIIIQLCSRKELSYPIPRCQTSTVCKFASNRRINTNASSTTRSSTGLIILTFLLTSQ